MTRLQMRSNQRWRNIGAPTNGVMMDFVKLVEGDLEIRPELSTMVAMDHQSPSRSVRMHRDSSNSWLRRLGLPRSIFSNLPSGPSHRSALQKKAPEAGPGGLQSGSIQAGDGNDAAIHGLNSGRNEAMNTCA